MQNSQINSVIYTPQVWGLKKDWSGSFFFDSLQGRLPPEIT